MTIINRIYDGMTEAFNGIEFDLIRKNDETSVVTQTTYYDRTFVISAIVGDENPNNVRLLCSCGINEFFRKREKELYLDVIRKTIEDSNFEDWRMSDIYVSVQQILKTNEKDVSATVEILTYMVNEFLFLMRIIKSLEDRLGEKYGIDNSGKAIYR